ncbi:MAG: ATP synthase subunit I [Deltaproteobacteria bacterium]|nr:ATP synthase subunit I [Deltaproteobacteria bacterium]MBW1747582.1 ATP synthase subunit I [Deltaproteobacteria bacterium]MBW1827050.1 ATP synthase subunit I [Deltaproteobacteria bacterium]MBW1969617.1 ATP synthase subunit I [Deltaproteobacteria bacterium]MBW2155608.1 ATP synthase subunit I [Deltaproteobacteria bacterium]
MTIPAMDSLRETQKKYCSRALIGAIFVGLFFIMAGQKPVGKGLILGTVFSIVNFIIIGEMLPLRIGKSKNKTFFFSLISICSRYILLAVPLIIAIKFDQYNIIAVIFGIFMVQLSILADHFLSLINSIRRKQA